MLCYLNICVLIETTLTIISVLSTCFDTLREQGATKNNTKNVVVHFARWLRINVDVIIKVSDDFAQKEEAEIHVSPYQS